MNQSTIRVLVDKDYDKNHLEHIGKVTIYTFLVILLLTLLVALFSKNRGQCSFAVWQNINFLQLVRWMGIISIDSNSEFESFFNGFNNYSTPIKISSFCTDQSISADYYKNLNMNSSGFLNNAKETLVIYVFIILVCLFTVIVNKLTSGEKFSGFIKIVKYSLLIRIHLLLLLDLLTYSMIDIYYYSELSVCSVVNFGLSLFFLSLGAFLVVKIPLEIKKRLNGSLETHHDVQFEPILTVVQEFKPIFKVLYYQYYTIFLFCKLSLAFSFAVLYKSPTVQLFVLASFQILMGKAYLVFYVGIARPFNRKSDSIAVFVSEFLLFALVILFGFRMLDIGYETKYSITIVCVFIIWAIEASIFFRFFFAFRNKSFFEIGEDVNVTSSQVIPEHLPKDSSISLKIYNNEGNITAARADFSNNKNINSAENSKKFSTIPRLNNTVISDSGVSREKSPELNKYTIRQKLSDRNSPISGISLATKDHIGQNRPEKSTMDFKIVKEDN